MENKPINVFLIDDEFPSNAEFVETGIYNKAISSENLYHLAISEQWGALYFLQELIKDIVTSTPCKNGLVNLIGFKNPAIALSAIEDELQPAIVIYDWEYGMPNPTESQQLLIEILKLTNAFVFVYSKVRDEIPPFLNKHVFTSYSERLQLFLKGSTSHSIFSSEEFILQYILGRVTDNVKIKIQGFDVEFTSNTFLKNASDILYLERIFGKMYLLDEFKKIQFDLNSYTIENLLNDSNGYVFFNELKGLLISPDEKAILSNMKTVSKLSYSQVAKNYSISKLEEILEKGVALI